MLDYIIYSYFFATSKVLSVLKSSTNIISSTINNSQISVFNSYEEDTNSFEFNSYDAFLWTGGLGNIYTSNQHNRDQLITCEKILKLEKPLWGSCWGLQVVATCFGDTIKKSTKPEFGYSDNIKIIKNHNVYENKQGTFSAPGHHYDCLESLCSEFEVISQNNLSIQSIAHKNKNIDCKNKKCRYWHQMEGANNCIINASQEKTYTLQEVGDLFNITRMRVCQIEKLAIKKLKAKSM